MCQTKATAPEVHSKTALMLSRTGGLSQRPADALVGARACGRLRVLEIARYDDQPAMAGTLLVNIGLLTSLTRLELPSIGPSLEVRNRAQL